MIQPPGFRGAAFGTARDGDARADVEARMRFSNLLGISGEWAFVNQVHGLEVAFVVNAGHHGEADAMVTETRGVPLAIATADCVPIVLEAERTTAITHAGWRGIRAGVVESVVVVMRDLDDPPVRAAIGPSIGPCCYEVGDDVARLFPRFAATTRGGARSVDLAAAVEEQLGDIETWRADRCTFEDEAFHSYRLDRTSLRQVAVTWLPTD